MNRYTVIKAVGKGTFGIVYEAEEYGTGRIVAVKKVFQDKNYKVRGIGCVLRLQNRELSVMKLLRHPNVVTLYNSFFSETENVCRFLSI